MVRRAVRCSVRDMGRRGRGLCLKGDTQHHESLERGGFGDGRDLKVKAR